MADSVSHTKPHGSRVDWQHILFNPPPPPDTNTDNIKKIENIHEASSQTGSCSRAGQLRFIQSATQETNSDATLYDHY